MRELVLEEQGFGIPLTETLVVLTLVPHILFWGWAGGEIRFWESLAWKIWREMLT